MAGLTLAGGGWMGNLSVCMMEEFNVKSIDAIQISNLFTGCSSLFPVIAAVLADSFLGCFSVIWISSLISLLGGIVLLNLTAILDSSRPPPFENGSSLCSTPSKVQFVVRYTGITLVIVGLIGARVTIGAEQFDKPKHQRIFFDWYTFTLYTCSAITVTAIVYVEDNVSWGWGFGLRLVANMLVLAIFLLGSHFYHRVKPQGSPFMGLARVFVTAIRKRECLAHTKKRRLLQ